MEIQILGKPLTRCGTCISYFTPRGLNFLTCEMGRKVRAYFVRLYWGLKDTRHIKHLKEHLIHREYQYRITFIFIREVEGAGGATVKPRFFWFSNCRGVAATFRACDNGGGTDLPWISCSSMRKSQAIVKDQLYRSLRSGSFPSFENQCRADSYTLWESRVWTQCKEWGGGARVRNVLEVPGESLVTKKCTGGRGRNLGAF